jgi:GWxTD domain-containing protein
VKRISSSISLMALLMFVLASPLLAGGLSKKFKEWDKSPEAYFLTTQEREEWKQVKTDDAAEKFIADYLARRGPEFRKMLDERMAVADRYFSEGKIKGSETLRGKVIIVFGPPSNIEQSSGGGSIGVGEGTNPNAGPSSDSGRGGGSPGTALTNVGPGAAGFATVDRVKTPIFSFVYDQEHAPKPIGRAFRVDLRMESAKTQTPVDAKSLDENFETMAKASIKTSEASKP